MARFASYRTDRQALCRLMDRLTRRRRRIRQAVVAAFVSALSFGTYAETPAVDLFVKLRAHSARKAETMTLEDLAALVDETDKELQSKGRVMVKQPDVWGQNRLTGPRDKYDKILKGDLDSFKLLIQGYRAELDNAALAYEGRIRAAMLRNAEGQRVDAFTDPDDLSSTSSIIINSQNPIAGTFSDASSALPTDVLNSGTTNNLKLANDDSGTGIGLEPTSFIDQKSRYLNHIHQKLRNNMGDDKTDMPGYGLYLMRMPVSVMPGSNTMRDNGAMVTAEIKHNLTPDLLKHLMQKVIIREATFNLVDNMRIYEIDPNSLQINTRISPGKRSLQQDSQKPNDAEPKEAFRLSNTDPDKGDSLKRVSFRQEQEGQGEIPPSTGSYSTLFDSEDVKKLYRFWSRNQDDSGKVRILSHQPDMYLWLFQELSNTEAWLEIQMANPQFKTAADNIRKAYLSTASQLKCSVAPCTNTECPNLKCSRENLRKLICGTVIYPKMPNSGEIRAILAYAYILHGAIVNEQLIKDMKIVAQRKGTMLDAASVMDFDCLNPDDLAQSFFMDYVQAKWPIQVFSLDPDIEQQNESEALSRRTDLQVALAAAIATGQTDMNQALQFSRRIEQQFATVGLNRTAVGFTAGATTFGWKFYPRLQTPPAQSNPERIASTIFMGGPTRRWDMAHRQIEPGPRECVALVVAPNFVSALRMTTTTNWFDLTPNMHHGNEKISNADMIRLGRQITMARHAFQRLCDDGHYRPGDIERLQDRITQLENMLPSQTTDVQLPFEGDWYGMELFASDGARLAPKLLMWNGEPGLKSSKTVKSQTTDAETGAVTTTFNDDGALKSIFLVGQGFVIGESKVIIGGAPVPPDSVELMSRNVMRVTIPADADTITLGSKPYQRDYYDVHVATPNGVSNHLYVETAKKAETASTQKESPKYGVTVSPSTMNLEWGFDDLSHPKANDTVDKFQDISVSISDLSGLRAANYNATISVEGVIATSPKEIKAIYNDNLIKIKFEDIKHLLEPVINKDTLIFVAEDNAYKTIKRRLTIETIAPDCVGCLKSDVIQVNKDIVIMIKPKLSGNSQSTQKPTGDGTVLPTETAPPNEKASNQSSTSAPPTPKSTTPQATTPAPGPSLEAPKAAPLDDSIRPQSFESTQSPVRRNPSVRPPYAAPSRNGVVDGGNPQNKRRSTNPSTPNQDALRASRLTGIPLPKP